MCRDHLSRVRHTRIGSQEYTGQPGHSLDDGNDRLATVLQALSDDTRWSTCEGP